jgi:AbrB family looped-hinge helix DNA binding protein
MAVTTMSTKGQVVIPARIRRMLGLGRNAKFQVEERDGRIVLTPIKERDWRSLGGCVEGRSLTSLLEQDRRSEREKR